MYYILLILTFTTVTYYYERSRHLGSNFLLILLLIVIYASLPALQYDVGTDYYSYLGSVYNEKRSLHFMKKGELLFYWIIKLIEYFRLPAEFLFVFSAFIQSFLFVNLIRILKRNGFSLTILVIIFFVVTGIYHNQLNGIRNYLAILTFLNFCLYMFEGRYTKAILTAVLGVFFHQTFIFALALLVIITLFRKVVYKNAIVVYIVFFMFFVLGIPMFALDFLVNVFAPFYSHYLEKNSGVDLVNIATRLIYVPLHIIFLIILCRRHPSEYRDNFETRLVSTWLVVSNVYFLMLYWAPFFRLIGYLTFFNIVPIYYLLIDRRVEKNLRYLTIVFLIAAYVPKVTFLSKGEYDYKSLIYRESESNKVRLD